MLRRELPQLADQRDVAPGGQVGLHAQLERLEALLLQPRDLRLREGLELQVGQRRAAPQRQRLAQQRRRLLRPPRSQRALPRLDVARETLRVELARTHAQPVARRRGLHDPRVAERLAQARHVHLHRLGRARRRVLAPQRERQPLRAHRLVGMQQQNGEQRAWLDAAQGERAALAAHFQRAEDPELHRASCRRYRHAALLSMSGVIARRTAAPARPGSRAAARRRARPSRWRRRSPAATPRTARPGSRAAP